MVIKQGDTHWIELEEPIGSEPGYSQPRVVIQNNVFNQSRIHTVIVCALTTNIKRANAPGNIVLEVGEANLPKQGVVWVSQIFTVDKTQFGRVYWLVDKAAGKSDTHRHSIIDRTTRN